MTPGSLRTHAYLNIMCGFAASTYTQRLDYFLFHRLKIGGGGSCHIQIGSVYIYTYLSSFIQCVICQCWETMDLHPRSYSSVADGSTSVTAVQVYTGVTILIATNACEDTVPWYCCVVFFPLRMLHLSDKPQFLLSLLQLLV